MPDVKSIYRAHKMAYKCLVGAEKGKCAFLGGFGVYTYTHAREGFGLSFLFRKQNKVGSDALTSLEN